jgi:predicted nuclease of predicted toxin-antitoxin system
MARYLVDEDLPRSLARAMTAAGLEAEDVRDVGLRGRPDREVLDGAVARGAALVSADLGFANLLAFPLGTHRGIVVVRFPNEVPNDVVNRHVVDALRGVSGEDLVGNLIIIEPTRVRLRRSGPRR